MLMGLIGSALFVVPAHAADCLDPYGEPTAECYNKGASLSGDGLRILDPQHGAFGGEYMEGGSFKMFGTVGDLAIGWSSGSSALQLKSGFLYWPLIIAPNITGVTTTTNSATITWSQLRGGLGTQAGLTNLSYRVCHGTTSPPITCVSASPGSTAVGSLAASTTHYFRVKAFGYYDSTNPISESEIVSATTQTSGGGGGGGGGGYIPPSTVSLTGLAFPYATVHIMLNGVEIATTPTDANAVFNVNTSIVQPGTTNYGFWGVDRLGRRSVTWAFSVPIGGSGRVRGLILPPTIVVNPVQLNPGGTVTVQGESVPGASAEVVMSPGGRSAMVTVGANGAYTATLSTAGLSSGVYDIKARTRLLPANDQSTWSQTIQIGVGVPAPAACNHPPDVNRDTRIDLVDFSIMAFWWRRDVGADNANDLNCDTRVDLQDFSILAYHWTGR